MLRFFEASYTHLSYKYLNELFSLRKITFKDRLDWLVSCHQGLEYDEYDNHKTIYLLGGYNNSVICGVRFIDTDSPNMITGVFQKYFTKFSFPEGRHLDASRLFVDKQRIKECKLQRHPISSLLFLSMMNFARSYNYEGIYAIVSQAMYIIFRNSGWDVLIMSQGYSEKEQEIFLIFMPIDNNNKESVIGTIGNRCQNLIGELDTWPISLNVRDNWPDEF